MSSPADASLAAVTDVIAFFDSERYLERLRVGEWVDWYNERPCCSRRGCAARRRHAAAPSFGDDGREYAQVLKAALDRRRGGR